MALALDALLIAVGLVLATTGIFIYRKALYGFGGLLGAAGGALLGTNLAGDWLLVLGAGVVGAVVGIWLMLSAYRMAILAAGAVSGLAVGLYASGGSFASPATIADPLVLVGLLAGAVVGWLLRKVIVLVVSAAWGAALVSIALSPPIADVTNVTEVVDAFVSPWLYGVFVAGIAVQVGLYGYLAHSGDSDDPAPGPLARLR
ncbi:hypothetical protein [Halapricum hydrolyticum]|uniref:DUF4203 domain-containing protein n=1 Tax=Halapricum hydrolyticum TaxID=2979991 RepID=A0AAE3ICG4_9EURY|nr:hypothetical protein [Halapricum hydrolyticum]MCU4717122.1 hypothetical protein [Halapricum hydrolyticum]MCU4726049.1 hypothetical protein [Halapricum hydrolyticum]